MKLDSARRWSLLLVGVLLLVGACAPAAETRPSAAGGGMAAETRRAPKVLNLARTEGQVGDFPGIVGRRPGGVEYIVHDYLVVRNDRDEFIPRLAAEQLSVDRGTWRINADGTMDTTWKLRPNVKWHDGAPFTSADMLFTFQAFKDPELPSRYGEALRVMESASAPDPLTFTIKWVRPFATANEAPGLNPLPKHLLEETFLHDKANFGNSPRLQNEFVGLGAYRLTNWALGSFVELERFDDYFLGRPPLDKVVVKFIPDPNTVIANVMAGSVDMASGNHVDIDAAVELKQRWEGTGNQVRFSPLGDLQQLEIQFRAEYARPRAGLTDRTVRQALFHAIDRKSLADAVAHGLTPVADSWFAPTHVLSAQVDDIVPRYPYDPARALRMLAQMGWSRGPDGVLVHTSGERFELALIIQDATSDADQAILADQWKDIGVQTTLSRLPVPRDRQYESTQPGVLITSPKGFEVPYLDSSRQYTGNSATAANRWTGRNRGAYSNARVDELIDRLAVTIDPKETVPLHRQLLQEALTDVALVPLYFEVDSIVMRKGVTGPSGGTYIDWNFYIWDKVE